VYIALVALYANTPVSNAQFWGHDFTVAVWATPPDCESLLKNWNVLLTPITSLALSGEKAVVVRVEAPELIRIVTQAGGVQFADAVALVELLVVHELDVQYTNW
jgi:hypothetical protein